MQKRLGCSYRGASNGGGSAQTNNNVRLWLFVNEGRWNAIAAERKNAPIIANIKACPGSIVRASYGWCVWLIRNQRDRIWRSMVGHAGPAVGRLQWTNCGMRGRRKVGSIDDNQCEFGLQSEEIEV